MDMVKGMYARADPCLGGFSCFSARQVANKLTLVPFIASVGVKRGSHSVLGAVQTQSVGKPVPKGGVCYPTLSRGFLHAQSTH